MKHLVVVFVVCLGVVVNGSAATFYVDRQRPDDSGAATDWSSAKRSIQAAIDIAKAGDTVLVRPGVYDEGSTVSPNHAHSNRIVCTKDITIESTDGAEATIIMGRRDLADPGTYHGLGPDALRCVYMSVGRLKGFTLTGGATRDDTAESDLCRAGGLLSPNSATPVVYDCIVSNNVGRRGGGAFKGIFHRTKFIDNYASHNGGGVRESFLIDCLVANNTGSGVAYSGDLRAALNCTIVNNSTYGLQNAGGVNCIIVGNQSGLRTGTEYSISNSVIQSAHALGVNSIVTNNAFFVNPDGGDYRVFANSAAIDIGDALVTNGALPPAERRDIAGQPRLQGAGIDAGCYEGAVTNEAVVRVSASGAGVVSPVGTLYLTTLPTQIVLTATADVGAALRYFSINDADQKYAGESFVLHVRDADFYEVKAHFLTARYVAPDGSDANSGETLENPWRTLQYAVDTVPVGGMVLAAPGVYDEGSSVKASHNNRVAITRDVVLKSLEGAAVTYIVGATDPNGNQFGCGPNAMRCVYMNNGAVQGFTLTGGASSVSEGDADQAQVRGGGVYGGNTYEVTDCVISNNVASRGAASFFATVKRCLITRNRATNNGVLRDAKIYDSLIVDNTGSALRFGGNFVYNCTISGNSGGGVLDAVVAYNSIIYNNGSTDVHTTGVCTNCLTGDVLRPGAGNIIGEPLFVDAPNGDYRLLALSPCVDTGALEYVVPRYREDFAGAPRVSGDSVNMGAYEGAVGAITASSTVGGQIEPVGDFLLNSNMTFKATALPGRLLRYFEINGVPVEGGGATLTINAQEYDGEAVIVRAVFQDGYYVDVQNGDDDNGGLEADEPLKSLQLAVDRALDGDTVRVAPGVYDSGSTIVEAGMLACRLAITKDITVEATGGAANTLIVGAASFGVDHFGSDAVRGVYMTSGRLNGFTICGGFTDSVDGGFENDCGGGIYVQTASVEMAIVDCVISNNTAYRKGGGGSNGRYHRCLITGNSIVAGAPSAFGAGIRNGLLYDCVVAFNNGSSGIAHATLRNVTYYDHSPILNCEVANSIVQCIGGGDGMVAGDSTFKVYCSCVSGSLASGNNGSGNIFERPLMLDPQSGDFRLHSTSPCIDSGSVVRYESGFWQDFSGGTRLAGAQIDMGALEGGIGGVLAIPGVEGGGVIEPAVSLYTNQLPATLTFTAQPFDGREFLYFVTNGVALPYAGNTLQLTFDDDIMIDLQAVFAGTLYADANQPDDSGDGITWQSAKRTLQAAVDAAYDHDTIVVAPGVYEEGDAVTPTVGGYLKNRVVILKNITLRSRDGAQVTTIRGALDPNTDDSYGRGPDAMRCVYMRQGVLEGFTLTGGATDRVNLEDENNRGGGFYADHFNYDPLVRECRLVANASMRGGGSHAGTLERCLFDGNYAEINSAAMRGGEAHNCLMINSSGASAAVGWAGIYNCTVADNQPTGVTETRIYNCVISGNSQYGQCFNSCLTTEIKNPVAAENNIVANPLFVNAASGDYRLQSGSPAIDIGASSYVRELFGIDHSGGMRMQNGAVDAGAFEYDWHPQFAQALDAEGVVVDEITPFVMYDEDVGYVNGSALLLNGWAARTNGQSVVTVTIPWQVPFGRSVRLGYEVTGSGTLELYEGETLLETVVLADGRVEKKITTTQQRPFPLRAVYTVGVEDTGGALLDGFEGFGGLLLLLR